MLKQLSMTLAVSLAASVLAVQAPSSGESAEAPTDVRIAPGRFDTVRIGDSLASAAESDYFALDVRTACGTRDIWPTRPWRSSIDIYAGFGAGEGEVFLIGVFGEGISTGKGIEIDSTLAELRSAYGDRLIGPRTNDYGQWGYFIRTDDRRWIGFLLDANSADGRPSANSEITFMEVARGRRPALLRDGC